MASLYCLPSFDSFGRQIQKKKCRLPSLVEINNPFTHHLIITCPYNLQLQQPRSADMGAITLFALSIRKSFSPESTKTVCHLSTVYLSINSFSAISMKQAWKKGSITRLKLPNNKIKKGFLYSKLTNEGNAFAGVAFRKIYPLEVLCIIPGQAVLWPSHVPLDWHFLTEEPRRINPGSQLNLTIFGYTVRLPDIEPFEGEDRTPQLTAKK